MDSVVVQVTQPQVHKHSMPVVHLEVSVDQLLMLLPVHNHSMPVDSQAVSEVDLAEVPQMLLLEHNHSAVK